MGRTLEEYLELPYTAVIAPEWHSNSTWIYTVENPELPGCNKLGETVAKAFEALRVVRKMWVRSRLEAGEQVPLPALRSVCPRPSVISPAIQTIDRLSLSMSLDRRIAA